MEQKSKVVLNAYVSLTSIEQIVPCPTVQVNLTGVVSAALHSEKERPRIAFQ